LNPDTLPITLNVVSATDPSANSGPDRAVSRRREDLRKEAIREKRIPLKNLPPKILAKHLAAGLAQVERSRSGWIDLMVESFRESKIRGVFQRNPVYRVDPNDDYQVDGIVDDEKKDRTHKIALGGVVRVVYQEGTAAAVKAEATVRVLAVLRASQIIAQTGWLPPLYTSVLNAPAAKERRKIIQERYAQAGIRIEWEPATFLTDNPSGLTWATGTLERPGDADPIIVNPECKSLLDAAKPKGKEVQMFFVYDLDPGTAGYSIVAKYTQAADVAAGYSNKILISKYSEDIYTGAHELLHVLLQAKHPFDSPEFPAEFSNAQMLWHVDPLGGVDIAGLLGRKRMSENQCDKARKWIEENQK